jgi:hypothetical protein
VKRNPNLSIPCAITFFNERKRTSISWSLRLFVMDTGKTDFTTVDTPASEDNGSLSGVQHDDGGFQERLRNYVPDTAEEKRLVRKVDMFMVPTLWFMCVLAYVDRNNIVSNFCIPSQTRPRLTYLLLHNRAMPMQLACRST